MWIILAVREQGRKGNLPRLARSALQVRSSRLVGVRVPRVAESILSIFEGFLGISCRCGVVRAVVICRATTRPRRSTFGGMSPVDRVHAEAEVLAANETFYRAFSRGDLREMSRLWAHLTTVSCLHPGAQVLFGRDAVMKSWSSMLRRPPPVPLQCLEPRVVIAGNVAVVTCYEAGGDQPAHLAATNVFVYENLEWKMTHHHAGPVDPPVAPSQPRGVLN